MPLFYDVGYVKTRYSSGRMRQIIEPIQPGTVPTAEQNDLIEVCEYSGTMSIDFVQGFLLMVSDQVEQLEKKEETNRLLAESWNRQTEAINRRTRSENARTELEALQLASRPDLHHELKSAATDVVRRLKEGEEGSSNG